MSSGYLYCMTNVCMPNLLKIGMTERTPEERLKDANSPDTWRPPTPYIIEFAKLVTNPKQKEATLHKLLEQYTERVHPRREFFRLPIEDVRTFFELMDGENWQPSSSANDEESVTSTLSKEEEDLSEVDRARLTSFLETHYVQTGKSEDKMKTKDVYMLYSSIDKSPEVLTEKEFGRMMSKLVAKKSNNYCGLKPKMTSSTCPSQASNVSNVSNIQNDEKEN